MKKFLLAVTTLATTALISGCATHTSESKTMRANWKLGNTEKAQSEATDLAEEASETDKLIWRLEEGATARANGDFKKSEEAFKVAQNSISQFEKEAETQLLHESEAVLTNQSYLTYKGYAYDKIMMSAYQALNHIELKDFEAAAVDLKRLEFYQKDAEKANISRIESAKSNKNSATTDNVSKTLNDPRVANALQQVYGDAYIAGNSTLGAKAVYVNPFGYWLSGLYFANKAVDTSDKNRAADMFRLGLETLDNKSYVLAEDFKMAEDLANGKFSKPSKITYVIFETGCAPIREQIRLDLPLYAFGNLPHVSMNFPYLKEQESYSEDISIIADANAQKLDELADMDAIISEQFNNDLPIVIMKTILSASIKAASQYAAASAAGNGWEGLVINIAGSIYQSMMNDADLRTWTTLPKKIKVARFKTPTDGKVLIEGKEVKVSTDGVNVILAKKMDTNGKIILRTFDFSDAKKQTK